MIDLCIILAGPTCGRTMAEFGADVIKIDSPHRAGVAFHNDINRGKRSVLIDLKTDEGWACLRLLVEGADVVVQNFRKGVAERLGIGYWRTCAPADRISSTPRSTRTAGWGRGRNGRGTSRSPRPPAACRSGWAVTGRCCSRSR
ncbi:MAG: CoA transferase [Dehalococcoidia bacterium]